LINIGDSHERSIKEVANIISDTLSFSGNIIWDTEMPTGQLRKPCDMSRLKKTGLLQDLTSFEQAIRNTAIWFEANYERVIE